MIQLKRLQLVPELKRGDTAVADVYANTTPRVVVRGGFAMVLAAALSSRNERWCLVAARVVVEAGDFLGLVGSGGAFSGSIVVGWECAAAVAAG